MKRRILLIGENRGHREVLAKLEGDEKILSRVINHENMLLLEIDNIQIEGDYEKPKRQKRKPKGVTVTDYPEYTRSSQPLL